MMRNFNSFLEIEGLHFVLGQVVECAVDRKLPRTPTFQCQVRIQTGPPGLPGESDMADSDFSHRGQ